MNAERRLKYSSQASSTSENSKGILKVNLDVKVLDMMCRAIVTANQTLRRGQLVNLRSLIYSISPEAYINDATKSKMVSFIKKGIEARLEFGLNDPYQILTHINGGFLDSDIVNLDDYDPLSGAELAWMNNMVSESLKFTHTYSNADRLLEICTRLKTAEYGSKAEIVKEFEAAINDTQNEFRRSKNEDRTDSMFSLREGYFEDMMYDTHATLSSPRRKLVTGMQGMNEMLGGGFENGRCYVYFGLPGEGKSTIILNIIYQIKKYNRDYVTKDPTKRPCVVLLTMENTVTESIERLFGMATGYQHMTDFTPDNAIRMLREEGELYLSDASPIDIIIQFKPSNSVDTSYLYTLTEDLEDQGLEVIAMFQDYIGRIRSTEHLADTRLEYGAVVDEFKTFAEIKDIPVITVAQLNRDASKHIDEGRKSSKSDLVRLIGRSNISESMLILNNIDAGFLIAPELTQEGERYLGVQRIKIRYDAGDREYVYLPFMGNTLKLIEDYGSIACFKNTLREDYASQTQQSQYQINAINDLGRIMQKTENDSNIFSTKIYNQNSIDALANNSGLIEVFIPNDRSSYIDKS